jgi:hypothetical protein
MTQPLRTCALALLPLLAACTAPSPRLDATFGQSVSLLHLQQVRNPQAGSEPATVDGIDGQAGASAYKNYQKSYQTPLPPPPAVIINLGGGNAK